MVIFFNIPNVTVAITMQVANALMASCLHARNARMRASMQEAIFPCRYK